MPNDNTLRLFIGNLGKYNEGELVGEWIDLPVPDEELTRFLTEEVGLEPDPHAAFGRGMRGEEVYEEYMIQDVEQSGVYEHIEIGEYSNLGDLNLIAKGVSLLGTDQAEALAAYLECENSLQGLQLMNAVAQADDLPYYAYGFENSEATDSFGQAFIDRIGADERYGYTLLEGSELKDVLERWDAFGYFDVEAYGRDAALNDGASLADTGYIPGNLSLDLDRYTRDEIAGMFEEAWAESLSAPADLEAVLAELKQSWTADKTKGPEKRPQPGPASGKYVFGPKKENDSTAPKTSPGADMKAAQKSSGNRSRAQPNIRPPEPGAR